MNPKFKTVLVTGTSSGIGLEIAKKFLEEDFTVYGFDKSKPAINSQNYYHYILDITQPENYPELPHINILVNSAGIQEEFSDGRQTADIAVNLEALISVTEKYGIKEKANVIINIASIDGHIGMGFPRYVASKGGVLAYSKNVAGRVADWGGICNSISPGGVETTLNRHILENPNLWKKVANENLLGKWIEPKEIAEWVYFLAVINKSMTGQDIIIDNGEMTKSNFIW